LQYGKKIFIKNGSNTMTNLPIKPANQLQSINTEGKKISSDKTEN